MQDLSRYRSDFFGRLREILEDRSDVLDGKPFDASRDVRTASSTDKAFFGAVLPMAALGVYSIARTFADMGTQLAGRLGALIVFPTIARFAGEHQSAAARIRAAPLALTSTASRS